jgi:hypothetical protein
MSYSRLTVVSPLPQAPSFSRNLTHLAVPNSLAGALADRGLSFDKLQKLKPGLIYAELRAYGFTGPWKDVRGVSLSPIK